jgi:Family of unknown function (DUF6404)
MPFLDRRDFALKLMDDAGVEPRWSRPPMWRHLWRRGINLPSPLFMPFWQLAALFGVIFAIPTGALSWLIIWRNARMPLPTFCVATLFEGAVFGVAIASTFAYRKRRFELPDWQNL